MLHHQNNRSCVRKVVYMWRRSHSKGLLIFTANICIKLKKSSEIRGMSLHQLFKDFRAMLKPKHIQVFGTIRY